MQRRHFEISLRGFCAWQQEISDTAKTYPRVGYVQLNVKLRNSTIPSGIPGDVAGNAKLIDYGLDTQSGVGALTHRIDYSKLSAATDEVRYKIISHVGHFAHGRNFATEPLYLPCHQLAPNCC